MKLLYKILMLLALLTGYVLLVCYASSVPFARDFNSMPSVYARLFTMFLAGAVTALFVQGPQYGTIDPISSRPIWVILGVLLMGGSLLWTLAIRGH